MTNEQGGMHPSGGVFIGGNSGIRRTLLPQGLTAWRLKKRLVKQYPRSGMETGRGSRKQRATKAPPTSWAHPTTWACGRLPKMRSVLLATAVLMIIASGCTSQAASRNPPPLRLTWRTRRDQLTHRPPPQPPSILPSNLESGNLYISLSETWWPMLH